MSKKPRDNAYWLGRLEREFPAIYSRYRSGAIPSVRAARLEAGLMRQPGIIDELLSRWEKATPSERDAFLRHIGAAPASTPTPRSKRSPGTLKHPLLDASGFLTKKAISRIDAAIARRGWVTPSGARRLGKLLTEMGRNKLDPRLGNALKRRWQPDADFLDALTNWLASTEGS